MQEQVRIQIEHVQLNGGVWRTYRLRKSLERESLSHDQDLQLTSTRVACMRSHRDSSDDEALRRDPRDPYGPYIHPGSELIPNFDTRTVRLT